MSQYRQANKIFTSNSCLIFSVFLMDLEHASYFDKPDLPLSTESEDSALSQPAVLDRQVWLWDSQTSRIPLSHWFALSRWCHQGYQPQPMLLDILYAKWTAVDNSLSKCK